MKLSRSDRAALERHFGTVRFRSPFYYIGDHVVVEIAHPNYRGNTGQRKNMFTNNNGPKVGLKLKPNEVAWRGVPILSYGSILDALNQLFKRRPRLKALVLGNAEDDDEIKDIQRRAGIQKIEKDPAYRRPYGGSFKAKVLAIEKKQGVSRKEAIALVRDTLPQRRSND